MTTIRIAAEIPPYLTMIPDRIPYQKTHRNLGEAKNAVAYHAGGGRYLRERIDGTFTGQRKYVSKVRGGQIWKLAEDGKAYELLYDIPPGSYQNELPWRLDEFEYYVAD